MEPGSAVLLLAPAEFFFPFVGQAMIKYQMGVDVDVENPSAESFLRIGPQNRIGSVLDLLQVEPFQNSCNLTPRSALLHPLPCAVYAAARAGRLDCDHRRVVEQPSVAFHIGCIIQDRYQYLGRTPEGIIAFIAPFLQPP